MPVTTARKDLVSNLVRYSENIDSSVLTRNPRARVDERISPFDLESDASGIVTKIGNLLGPKRGVYSFEYIGDQYSRQVGDTIVVTHSGLGLTNAEGIIISLQESSNQLSTKIEVFI